MSESYLRLCRGCWRIVESNQIELVDNSCTHISIKPAFLRDLFDIKAVDEYTAFQEKFRPVLWSIFPQCEINFDATIDGISLNTTPTKHLVFDVVVPEYRLAIDFEHSDQTMPFELDNTNQRYLRMAFDDVKYLSTRNNNWRHIKLPRDIVIARNILLQCINEIYILKHNDESQILPPKLQGDVGFDIICNSNILCPPHGFIDIPSNLNLEMPNHLYAIVQARSSTSRRGIIVLPGIIDSAYRGEIFTMVHNLGDNTVQINKGDRVAQLLFFNRVSHIHLTTVDQLRPSIRQNKGFGSTND